jgi:D-alanyl-lipoteichoic acid acyltransferase DltB (MBOAT superfamily)
MSWNPKYAILMFISTALTYASGMLISREAQNGNFVNRKKLYVALSFVPNLLILGFFKYIDFLFDTINRIGTQIGFSHIENSFDFLLPVGISFYTFQALSYTMDVYRNAIKAERNFLKYALFVSFFPLLVAGPIERAKNLIHQIHERHDFDYDRMKSGLLQMLWGFFLKLMIADRISISVDLVFDNWKDYQGIQLVWVIILFSMQIYCDFASYTNIARGAAKVLGFSATENFRTPYFSQTVAEFWRRWHISLTSWFRDYLYIPLGGSRKGAVRKYLNVMIVFLVSGLWHGASWHFVIWGALNGLYQIIEGLIDSPIKRFRRFLGTNDEFAIYKILRICRTFVLVCLAWIFFRAESASVAIGIIRNIFVWNPMVMLDGGLYELGLSRANILVLIVALLIMGCVSFCNYRGITVRERLMQMPLIFQWPVYFASIIVILVIGIWGPIYDAKAFIYFQF